ncbi:MAG: DUF192 domain-containing protein [Actinomycetota bacterium]|nr:DUF192 domain-containing protein [Actinomycetota bacterium]
MESDRYAVVINKTAGKVLAERASVALKPRERLRGLIGRESMEAGEALVIPRSKQIHTFGMRFDIDVLFLDKGGRVVKACPAFVPRRLSPFVFRSATVIELPSGVLNRSGTKEWDIVKIVT